MVCDNEEEFPVMAGQAGLADDKFRCIEIHHCAGECSHGVSAVDSFSFVGIDQVWSHCWTYLLDGGDRMGQDNGCTLWQ